MKRETVPLTDIEFVTNRVIKVPFLSLKADGQDAVGIRKTNPTSNEDLRNELLDVYLNPENVTEVDWSKIRDLAFNEDRELRAVAVSKITGAHCLECPDFLEHVSLNYKAWLIAVRETSRRVSYPTKDRGSSESYV